MGSKGILEFHRFFATGSGTGAVQPSKDATDLGEYGDVTLVVYVEDACLSGTLYLQSAPERCEALFTRVSGISVSLSAMGAKTVHLPEFSRYLRWEVDNPGNNQHQFSIDVLGRVRAQ